MCISSQHMRLPESQWPQACRTFRLHVVCAVGQTSAGQQPCLAWTILKIALSTAQLQQVTAADALLLQPF